MPAGPLSWGIAMRMWGRRSGRSPARAQEKVPPREGSTPRKRSRNRYSAGTVPPLRAMRRWKPRVPRRTGLPSTDKSVATSPVPRRPRANWSDKSGLSRTSFASWFCRSMPFGTIRTSLDLDAIWAIQVVSSPDRFDGSVSRSDPSGGRRRHGTGRARSSRRLPAGRPAIRLERRPVGVGAGNRGRIVPLPPAGVARPDWLVPFGTVGRRRRRAGRFGSAGTPGGPDRADQVGPGISARRARRRRPRP